MMLLRVRSLALGHSGVRPLVAQSLVDLLNADITPWVPEHGSLGASGDLAPLAHCALVLLGEGWVLGKAGARIDGGRGAAPRPGCAPIDAGRQGGPGADQRHRRHARHAAAGDRRRGAPVRDGRRDRGAGDRGDARLGTAVPCPSCTRSGRTRARPASAANIHRLLQGSADHGLAPRRPGARGAGRVLDAVRPAGGRRGPRHAGVRRPGRRARAAVGGGQPGGPAGRPGRVDRQLPRRAARLRGRLPGDRRGRGGRDRRTPGGPAARRDPLPRAAAVPVPRRRASTPA